MAVHVREWQCRPLGVLEQGRICSREIDTFLKTALGMILGPGRDRMLGYLEHQMTLYLYHPFMTPFNDLRNHTVGQPSIGLQ